MPDLTRILSAIESGETQAAAELLPLVYDELRKLAADRLRHEKPGQTLQATALVHEAYVRLVGGERRGSSPPDDRRDKPGGSPTFANRAHFFAAAAEAMRRILVDRAREKAAEKRGGDRQRIDIDDIDLANTVSPDQLLAVDEALAKLTAHDPVAGRLVELRFFAGLSVDDAGRALGISTASAYRHWNYARAWLHSELM
jgi:RNA polymerase sigma factor (TIGR02999 family)